MGKVPCLYERACKLEITDTWFLLNKVSLISPYRFSVRFYTHNVYIVELKNQNLKNVGKFRSPKLLENVLLVWKTTESKLSK